MKYIFLILTGMNKTCVAPPLACNCNAKVPDWLVDEGKITDKSRLPVTEFAYGPLDYDVQKAKVQIGSLKCSGIFKIIKELGAPKNS